MVDVDEVDDVVVNALRLRFVGVGERLDERRAVVVVIVGGGTNVAVAELLAELSIVTTAPVVGALLVGSLSLSLAVDRESPSTSLGSGVTSVAALLSSSSTERRWRLTLMGDS